jgi:spore coat polysaccharide biosynthesis protein SpsF
MILGTVQLGMDYGRANTSGMPSASEAAELLFAAAASGIDTVDTARDYGLSELRIGDALMAGLAGSIDVVTKLDPLTALPEDASDREVRSAVDASVYRSCRDLRVRTLDTLLLHRWSLRRSHRGRVWDRLLELRAEGVVGSLGASVQSPPEALEAFADVDVAHVQLPINVLDRRWVAVGVDDAARARPGVVVDARSVFLQGVLLLDSEKWPRVPGVDAAAIVRELDALVAQLDRSNRADLCVAFVKSLDWVDGLVVGVERTEQLLENVRQFGGAELDATERQLVLDRLPRVPDALLDPSQWDRGRE